MVSMAQGLGCRTVSSIGWAIHSATRGGQGTIPPPICNMDIAWKSGTRADPPKLQALAEATPGERGCLQQQVNTTKFPLAHCGAAAASHRLRFAVTKVNTDSCDPKYSHVLETVGEGAENHKGRGSTGTIFRCPSS